MSNDEQGRRVPSSRLSRLGSFSRLVSGIAGGMVAEGARRLGSGDRPRLRDMVLTPGNVARVADQLAHLRGAAMKLGQMISMDAGDLLPPELAEIMGRLRERAYRMPPAQLQQVLATEWGPDWRQRYARFDPAPVAAASIGQVHRATTLDGRDLAIKVQYPGVAKSIDADIDNVATLLRVSGLLPAGLDIAPLLADAKQQLRDEADYLREGALMVRLGALLAGAPSFVVPTLNPDLTTGRVLAMSFEEGVAVETLESAPQDVRDRVMTMLVSLVLRGSSNSASCRPIPILRTSVISRQRKGWSCSTSGRRGRSDRARKQPTATCYRPALQGIASASTGRDFRRHPYARDGRPPRRRDRSGT